MTERQIKQFLIKKKSYLRWGTYRLTRKFMGVGDSISNNWTKVKKSKESAKKYLKKKGISW